MNLAWLLERLQLFSEHEPTELMVDPVPVGVDMKRHGLEVSPAAIETATFA